MMTFGAEAEVRAYADDDVQVLDLYYGGKAYSMTILVPAAGDDLDVLIGSLDSQRWQEIVNGLAATVTDVVLPKFTLEYELEMKDVLTALGMGIAFGGAADFSKIRSSGGLYISKVKHKTFVDVNEEGTEAAAATSVEISETTAVPPTFVIDRPFLFAIREQFSGTILFMGRIVNPVDGDR